MTYNGSNFVIIDNTKSIPQLESHSQCPSIFGKNKKKAIINISPKYYQYQFCTCLSGYYNVDLHISGNCAECPPNAYCESLGTYISP